MKNEAARVVFIMTMVCIIWLITFIELQKASTDCNSTQFASTEKIFYVFHFNYNTSPQTYPKSMLSF